jgi:hypothetical protein
LTGPVHRPVRRVHRSVDARRWLPVLGWAVTIRQYGGVAMAEEREHTERFTDEELAFLRYARFSELPARVRPDERVELVETDARRDLPEGIDPDAVRYPG